MARSVDPRFPIGRAVLPGRMTRDQREHAFQRLQALPCQLHDAVRGLDTDQLDTPYRDGGWTVRQVVHHIADSHVHAYCRHKLTVSEHRPVIQAYDENAWSRMPDANAPIGASLLIVQSIHGRLVHALRALPDAAFARTAVHSEDGEKTLDDLVATYAWHGAHHVAHITTLRARQGW